jgi:hypothetical protein
MTEGAERGPDPDAYRGEWVALIDDRVVAHDRNLSELLRLVGRKFPEALLLQVPEEDVLIYANGVEDGSGVSLP